MKAKISIKTLYRSPVRMVLTFVLLVAVTFTLFSQVLEHAVTVREIDKAAEQYDGGIDGDEIDAVSSRPDAAILCYAVSTLGEYTHIGTRNNLTGGDLELCEKLTGEKNIPDDCPPMFIWHTAEDGAVPVQNALIMGMKLKEKNIPFEMHIFPEGPHGVALFYDAYPYPTKWAELCVNWLRHIDF